MYTNDGYIDIDQTILDAQYEDTPQDNRLERLAKAKKDKLGRLHNDGQGNYSFDRAGYDTALTQQQNLSNQVDDQVYSRDDGSHYQIDYMIDPKTGLSQGTQEIEYEKVDKYGNPLLRNLYIDDTKNNEMKLGLANYKAGYNGRYNPNDPNSLAITANYAKYGLKNRDGTPKVYGWSTGENGVTYDNGALMEITSPYNQITQFEAGTHQSQGQLKNRSKYGDLGPGKNEYTTQNAPMWNSDYVDDGSVYTKADGYIMDDQELKQEYILAGGKEPSLESKLDALIAEAKKAPDNRGWVDKATGRLGNTAAAAGSMALWGLGGLGDLVAEGVQKAGNMTGIDALSSDGEGLWKDGELKPVTDELLGYDGKYEQQAAKQFEDAYKYAKETGDWTEVVKAVGNGILTLELWGASAGFVLSMFVPGAALGSIAKYKKVSALVKSGEYANRATAAKAVEEATKQARGLVKLTNNLIRVQPGAAGYAQNGLGDARLEYKKLYGKEMSGIHQTGTFALNLLSANLEYWIDAGLLKGKNVVSDAFKKAFKDSPAEVQVNTIKKLTFMGETGKLVAAGLTETLQEGTQTAVEGYAVDFGEKTLEESLADREVEIATGMGLGFAGGIQMKGLHTAKDVLWNKIKLPDNQAAIDPTSEQGRTEAKDMVFSGPYGDGSGYVDNYTEASTEARKNAHKTQAEVLLDVNEYKNVANAFVDELDVAHEIKDKAGNIIHTTPVDEAITNAINLAKQSEKLYEVDNIVPTVLDNYRIAIENELMTKDDEKHAPTIARLEASLDALVQKGVITQEELNSHRQSMQLSILEAAKEQILNDTDSGYNIPADVRTGKQSIPNDILTLIKERVHVMGSHSSVDTQQIEEKLTEIGKNLPQQSNTKSIDQVIADFGDEGIFTYAVSQKIIPGFFSPVRHKSETLKAIMSNKIGEISTKIHRIRSFAQSRENKVEGYNAGTKKDTKGKYLATMKKENNDLMTTIDAVSKSLLDSNLDEKQKANLLKTLGYARVHIENADKGIKNKWLEMDGKTEEDYDKIINNLGDIYGNASTGTNTNQRKTNQGTNGNQGSSEETKKWIEDANAAIKNLDIEAAKELVKQQLPDKPTDETIGLNNQLHSIINGNNHQSGSDKAVAEIEDIISSIEKAIADNDKEGALSLIKDAKEALEKNKEIIGEDNYKELSDKLENLRNKAKNINTSEDEIKEPIKELLATSENTLNDTTNSDDNKGNTGNNSNNNNNNNDEEFTLEELKAKWFPLNDKAKTIAELKQALEQFKKVDHSSGQIEEVSKHIRKIGVAENNAKIKEEQEKAKKTKYYGYTKEERAKLRALDKEIAKLQEEIVEIAKKSKTHAKNWGAKGFKDLMNYLEKEHTKKYGTFVRMNTKLETIGKFHGESREDVIKKLKKGTNLLIDKMAEAKQKLEEARESKDKILYNKKYNELLNEAKEAIAILKDARAKGLDEDVLKGLEEVVKEAKLALRHYRNLVDNQMLVGTQKSKNTIERTNNDGEKSDIHPTEALLAQNKVNDEGMTGWNEAIIKKLEAIEGLNDWFIADKIHHKALATDDMTLDEVYAEAMDEGSDYTQKKLSSALNALNNANEVAKGLQWVATGGTGKGSTNSTNKKLKIVNGRLTAIEVSTAKGNKGEETVREDMSVNPLAVILSTNTSGGFGKLPDGFKNMVKIAVASSMGDIIESQSQLLRSGSDKDGQIRTIWGTTNDTETPRKLMREGKMPKHMIESKLGSVLIKMLPIKFTGKEPHNTKADLAAALGALGFKYLFDNNLVQVDTETTKNGVDTKISYKKTNIDGKSIIPVRILLTGPISPEEWNSLKDATDKLELSPVRERRGLNSSPVKTIPKYIRHTKTEVTDSDTEYMKDVQSTPYKFNEFAKELHKMWNNGSDEGVAKVYALLRIDEPITDGHIEDTMSSIADNNANKLIVATMMEQYTEDEFYFDSTVLVNGRYSLDNNTNPVESKIVRMLTGTQVDEESVHERGMNSVVRFGNKDESIKEFDLHMFQLSLAQALDMDADKQLDESAIADLNKEMVTIKKDGTIIYSDDGKGPLLKKAVEAMVNDTDDLPKLMKKIFPHMEGYHGMAAIHTLALLTKHNKENKGKDFNHTLQLESDAITSGMALTLMEINSEEAINMLERMGIYSEEAVKDYKVLAEIAGLKMPTNRDGEEQVTHGLLLEMGKKLSSMDDDKLMEKFKEKNIEDDRIDRMLKRARFTDLYTMVADEVRESVRIFSGSIDERIEEIQKKLKDIKSEKEKEELAETLETWEIAKKLLKVIPVESIVRSLAKKPVMVYIYGSAISSIKKKILFTLVKEQMLKNFKEDNEFSNLGDDQAAAAMKSLVDYMKGSEVEPEYKEYNAETDSVVTSQNYIPKNMILPTASWLKLQDASDLVFGDAFEGVFNNHFRFVDNYRDVIKTFETLRYAINRHAFKKEVDELIAKKKAELNGESGEVVISEGEMREIAEKVNEDYGHHTARENGGKLPLSKTERVSGSAINSTTKTTTKGKSTYHSSYAQAAITIEISNTGAASVTTIHDKDGSIISGAVLGQAVLNIYDAIVSGMNNNNKLNERYNEKAMDSWKSSGLIQKEMRELLVSLAAAAGPTEDTNKTIISQMSYEVKDHLFKTFTTLMDMKNTRGQNSPSNPQVEIPVGIMMSTIDDILRDTDKLSGKFHILHGYVSDKSKAHIGEHEVTTNKDDSQVEQMKTVLNELSKELADFREVKTAVDSFEKTVESILSDKEYDANKEDIIKQIQDKIADMKKEC
jgi:hypothetical protein